MLLQSLCAEHFTLCLHAALHFGRPSHGRQRGCMRSSHNHPLGCRENAHDVLRISAAHLHQGRVRAFVCACASACVGVGIGVGLLGFEKKKVSATSRLTPASCIQTLSSISTTPAPRASCIGCACQQSCPSDTLHLRVLNALKAYVRSTCYTTFAHLRLVTVTPLQCSALRV